MLTFSAVYTSVAGRAALTLTQVNIKVNQIYVLIYIFQSHLAYNWGCFTESSRPSVFRGYNNVLDTASSVQLEVSVLCVVCCVLY